MSKVAELATGTREAPLPSRFTLSSPIQSMAASFLFTLLTQCEQGIPSTEKAETAAVDALEVLPPDPTELLVGAQQQTKFTSVKSRSWGSLTAITVPLAGVISRF